MSNLRAKRVRLSSYRSVCGLRGLLVRDDGGPGGACHLHGLPALRREPWPRQNARQP